MINMSNHGHIPNIGLLVHDCWDLAYCEIHLDEREKKKKKKNSYCFLLKYTKTYVKF